MVAPHPPTRPEPSPEPAAEPPGVVAGRCCRRARLGSAHGDLQGAIGPGLPLHRVRLDDGQVGRPVRRVPGVGHGRGGRARPGCARSAPVPSPAPAAAHRRGRRRGGAAPRHRRRTSSTACSAAGWSPAPSSCWPASPGWASRRCCSTSRARAAAPGAARPLRHRRGVRRPGAAARRADRRRRRRPCTSPPRPTSAAVLGHVEAVAPDAARASTPCRPSASPDVDGSAGGVTQVREVAGALIAVAKHRNITTLLVGHVTKDGSIAGPRVLEHLVDVVLPVRGRPRTAGCAWCARPRTATAPTDEVGLLRARRRRHRRAAPTRAGCSSPAATSRCPAPASRSPSRAAGRCWPRCRRWSRLPSAAPARGGPPAGSTPPGSRWCSPCSNAARGVPARATRRLRGHRRRGPAHRAGRRPRRGAGRRRRPRPTCRCRRARRRRRGGPGRRGAPVTGLSRRLAEAARLGFTHAIVPRDPGPCPTGSACSRSTTWPRCSARCADRVAFATGPATRPHRRDASPPLRSDRAPSSARGAASAERREGARWRRRPRTSIPTSRCAGDRHGRPRHGPARRPRAHPARPHRRAHRDRPRQGQSTRCAAAASPSTSTSPPPGCASWRRWTARSSSTATSPRILRAAVQLLPDPTIPTDETGTRHRTADRVAAPDRLPRHQRQQVDEHHRALRRRPPARARGLRADPVPGQPGAGHPRALQAAPRRGQRHALGAGDRGPRHRARRRRGRPAAGDGAPDLRSRSRATSSSSAPTVG